MRWQVRKTTGRVVRARLTADVTTSHGRRAFLRVRLTPDPADPSHFTIDYDLNGTRHTVDGWLEDDEFVKMELRN